MAPASDGTQHVRCVISELQVLTSDGITGDPATVLRQSDFTFGIDNAGGVTLIDHASADALDAPAGDMETGAASTDAAIIESASPSSFDFALSLAQVQPPPTAAITLGFKANGTPTGTYELLPKADGTTQGPIKPSTHGFDRVGMVAWTQKFWNYYAYPNHYAGGNGYASYTPQHPEKMVPFPDDDCADFVSRALKFGGHRKEILPSIPVRVLDSGGVLAGLNNWRILEATNDKYWFMWDDLSGYKSWHPFTHATGYSHSWTVGADLAANLAITPSAGTWVTDWRRAVPGDVIFFQNPGAKGIGHSAIITKVSNTAYGPQITYAQASSPDNARTLTNGLISLALKYGPGSKKHSYSPAKIYIFEVD